MVSDYKTFYKLLLQRHLFMQPSGYIFAMIVSSVCQVRQGVCRVGESPVVPLVVGKGVVHTGAVVQNDAVVRVHRVAQRRLSCRHPCRQTLDH